MGSSGPQSKANQADLNQDGNTDIASKPGQNSEITSIDRNTAFKVTHSGGRCNLEKLGDLWNKLQDCLFIILQHVSNLFTSPLVKDPIYFSLPESGMARVTATGCVYETATKELIDGVFEERKERIKGKDTQNFRAKLKLDQFPGWDEATIDQLREEFRVFGKNNDGVISFQNMSDALDTIGNKSTKAERRSHFDMVDTDHSGSIDFREFCVMVYNLDHSQEEFFSDILYDLYKSLDRDTISIPNLTVLQQLQAGLF
ncbi:unnamed protein product [Allacma fusca]|uniref:EF-hand domain-containing protein n=1 Tax=Allacma fusca TaxID=39272 RepID=A0A8J2JCL8_9HEXA|nr:unnamed protein product [Allacma fusca]